MKKYYYFIIIIVNMVNLCVFPLILFKIKNISLLFHFLVIQITFVNHLFLNFIVINFYFLEFHEFLIFKEIYFKIIICYFYFHFLIKFGFIKCYRNRFFWKENYLLKCYLVFIRIIIIVLVSIHLIFVKNH